jgi:tetratricopeptide (TPR) repeat protein
VAGVAAKQAFSREAACRLVDVSERQLKSWERQELVAPSDKYSFKDLLALRTLAKLKGSRLPAAQIRRTLHALSRKMRGTHDPLTQLKIYVDGRKIRVEIEGRAMEAESGQLLLDFDPVELQRLVEFRAKEDPHAERNRRAAADRWFQKGLELERSGSPPDQIIEAYEKALELDPGSAGALVNLGTIHFNARNWKQAEHYYRGAVEADPNYALAHFDLANLYDERGDRGKALEHYQAALRASPNYADAHYNLALLFQGSNQPMKAAQHWQAYLKLDPSSQWAKIARRELSKIRQVTVVARSPSS